jgi:hypothetical protein
MASVSFLHYCVSFLHYCVRVLPALLRVLPALLRVLPALLRACPSCTTACPSCTTACPSCTAACPSCTTACPSCTAACPSCTVRTHPGLISVLPECRCPHCAAFAQNARSSAHRAPHPPAVLAARHVRGPLVAGKPCVEGRGLRRFQAGGGVLVGCGLVAHRPFAPCHRRSKAVPSGSTAWPRIHHPAYHAHLPLPPSQGRSHPACLLAPPFASHMRHACDEPLPARAVPAPRSPLDDAAAALTSQRLPLCPASSYRCKDTYVSEHAQAFHGMPALCLAQLSACSPQPLLQRSHPRQRQQPVGPGCLITASP